MLVLTRHTAPYWGGGGSFHHAYLAVDLFFMLSGFVISHAYDIKLVSNVMSFWSFLLTRIIRLYPLYLLAALLSAMVFAPKSAFMNGDVHTITEYLGALLLNLLYLPSKFGRSNALFPINGVCWSLFFEISINIVYALCRRSLTNISLVVVILVSGGYLVAQSILTGSLDHGFIWDWQSVSIGSARTVYGFSCGLLLHRVYLKTPVLNVSTVKSIFLLLIAIAPLLFPNMKGNELIDSMSIIVIFPFCVFLGAKINPKNITYHFYEILGVISYPIYLFHDSIGTGVFRVLKFLGFDIKQFAPFSGFLLISGLICFALLLDCFYDRPLRRFFSAIAFRNKNS